MTWHSCTQSHKYAGAIAEMGTLYAGLFLTRVACIFTILHLQTILLFRLKLALLVLVPILHETTK